MSEETKKLAPMTEAWRLPCCVTVVPVGRSFCPNCGRRIEAPEEIEAVFDPDATIWDCICGGIEELRYPFCSRCGRKRTLSTAFPAPFIKVSEWRSMRSQYHGFTFQYTPLNKLDRAMDFNEHVLMDMIRRSGQPVTRIHYDSDDDCGGVCTSLDYDSFDEYLDPERTHPGDDFVAIMDRLIVYFSDVSISMNLNKNSDVYVTAKDADFDLNSFLFPSKAGL